MNLYKEAAQRKLRFDSPVGKLSAEELFELPLKARSTKAPCLNNIAKDLNRALKQDDEEDFVTRKTKPNLELKIKFDIVLDVIKVTQDKAEAAERRELNRQKKTKILGFLAKKQDEALEGQSEEDLRKLLNELGDDDLE